MSPYDYSLVQSWNESFDDETDDEESEWSSEGSEIDLDDEIFLVKENFL